MNLIVHIEIDGIDYGTNHFNGQMFSDAYYSIFDSLGPAVYGFVTDVVRFRLLMNERSGEFTTYAGKRVIYKATQEPEQVADDLAIKNAAPF